MSEFEREQRNREGVASITRLFSAQEKEITPTMLRFDGFAEDAYSIKIVDDSYGYLTCTIRQRKGGAMLHKVKFKKVKKQGVVYNFMDASRLNRLYIEESIFADLRLPI